MYGAKTFMTTQRGKHCCPTFNSYVLNSQACTAIELLRNNIGPGALHNSDEQSDPQKCHAHTREAIFWEIMDWIEDMGRQARLL